MTESPHGLPSPAATSSNDAALTPPTRNGDPVPRQVDLSRTPAFRQFTGWVLLQLGLSALLGVLSGVLWWRLVDLPVYVVGEDGRASTTERGLTEYFGMDAWFCLIGVVVGVGLGLVAWRWLSAAGWPMIVVAVLGSVVSALLCWYVGWNFGPGPLDPRLAQAGVGAEVPIELTVHTWVSVVVWVFATSIPLLLISALSADYEEPKPLRRSRINRRA